ncbi:hypothetical protein PR048_019208 [Dryococelus australis]|uniref:Uncharacterized protein n=1 Tax=Dryococelus australis TaxID=614101 RepID=A0ABQ9H2U9_9NEOP|nr:hypothetical protein PR048_019208 [Dryococelus australis]
MRTATSAIFTGYPRRQLHCPQNTSAPQNNRRGRHRRDAREITMVEPKADGGTLHSPTITSYWGVQPRPGFTGLDQFALCADIDLSMFAPCLRDAPLGMVKVGASRQPSRIHRHGGAGRIRAGGLVVFREAPQVKGRVPESNNSQQCILRPSVLETRVDNGAAPECNGGSNVKIPEKTRRPEASSDTAPICENPFTLAGGEQANRSVVAAPEEKFSTPAPSSRLQHPTPQTGGAVIGCATGGRLRASGCIAVVYHGNSWLTQPVVHNGSQPQCITLTRTRGRARRLDWAARKDSDCQGARSAVRGRPTTGRRGQSAMGNRRLCEPPPSRNFPFSPRNVPFPFKISLFPLKNSLYFLKKLLISPAAKTSCRKALLDQSEGFGRLVCLEQSSRGHIGIIDIGYAKSIHGMQDRSWIRPSAIFVPDSHISRHIVYSWPTGMIEHEQLRAPFPAPDGPNRLQSFYYRSFDSGKFRPLCFFITFLDPNSIPQFYHQSPVNSARSENYILLQFTDCGGPVIKTTLLPARDSRQGRSPYFQISYSCRTMPMIGRFSRRSPDSPPMHSGAAPHSPHLTLIGSQDHDRSTRSPPTKVNRVQSPAGSPDLRKWESCRTMQLFGRFSRRSPDSPSMHSGAAPHSPHLTLIGSQDHDRSTRSPPTKVNRVQSPAGSPDLRKWESCRTMQLFGGFSRFPRPFIPACDSALRLVVAGTCLSPGSGDLAESRKYIRPEVHPVIRSQHIATALEIRSAAAEFPIRMLNSERIFSLNDNNKLRCLSLILKTTTYYWWGSNETETHTCNECMFDEKNQRAYSIVK